MMANRFSLICGIKDLRVADYTIWPRKYKINSLCKNNTLKNVKEISRAFQIFALVKAEYLINR